MRRAAVALTIAAFVAVCGWKWTMTPHAIAGWTWDDSAQPYWVDD